MDMNRAWTQFAVDAEIEYYGTKRLCVAHNKLMAEVDMLRKLVKTMEEERNTYISLKNTKNI